MDTTAATLRISDAEREPVIERLKTAYADGQLDHDEFDLRVQLAMTARTHGDLLPLTRDLDAPVTWRPASPGAVTPLGPITGRDRLLAATAHATGLVPILVLPALMWATAGRGSAYLRHHAAQAFNLQLTLLLVTVVTFGIGAILYAVLWAVALAGAAMALLGSDFRYPWTLQLLGRRVTPRSGPTP